MDVRYVARVARMLWLGFEETALRELRGVASGAHAANVRISALTEIAKWYETFGMTAEAIEAVDAAVSLGAEKGLPNTPRAIAIDLLTSAGRLSDAQALLDRSPAPFRDSIEAILRRFNLVTSAAASEGSASQSALELLNSVFTRHQCLPIELPMDGARLALDNLRAVPGAPSVSGPLVSVIMPARNASDTIGYALHGLLAQTWTEIEVIVVDDGSADDTLEVAAATGDQRVRIERSPGKGAYAARNHGLACATGQFVTVHDADDWSHPEKIERQVRTLLDSSELIATMSARVSTRRALYLVAPALRPTANKVFPNHSSLLLHRWAFDVLGPWDTPAGSADAEFIARCRRFYGQRAVGGVLSDIPLSLTLRGPSSLTSATNGTGLLALQHLAGSRRHYRAEWARWHARRDFVSSLPFHAGSARAPFLRPRLLEIERPSDDHFDVVMLGDFSGRGTHGAVVEEIRAQTRAGFRTGLIHVPVYDDVLRHADHTSADITDNQLFDVVDGSDARFLSSGEAVAADVLIARSPEALQELVTNLPVVRAPAAVAVVDDSALGRCRKATSSAAVLERWAGSLSRLGHERVTWCPAGPAARAALLQRHDEDQPFDLGEDWDEVIDAEVWQRPARPASHGGRAIRIGWHASGQRGQPLGDLAHTFGAYPKDPRFEVRYLGEPTTDGAHLFSPASWTVFRYDDVTAAEFLSDLDVYVLPSRGVHRRSGVRGILEALAVGVPVVAAAEYEQHFGGAVITAEPEQAAGRVLRLMGDHEYYDEQVRKGYEVIEQRYCWRRHTDQIERVRTRLLAECGGGIEDVGA